MLKCSSPESEIKGLSPGKTIEFTMITYFLMQYILPLKTILESGCGIVPNLILIC